MKNSYTESPEQSLAATVLFKLHTLNKLFLRKMSTSIKSCYICTYTFPNRLHFRFLRSPSLPKNLDEHYSITKENRNNVDMKQWRANTLLFCPYSTSRSLELGDISAGVNSNGFVFCFLFGSYLKTCLHKMSTKKHKLSFLEFT